MEKTDELSELFAFAVKQKPTIAQDILLMNATLEASIAEVPDYEGKHEQLQILFARYRFLHEDDPTRLWIERWVVLHEEFCRNSQNELFIRQHNSFIRNCVLGSLSAKSVGRMHYTTERTVFRDIHAVINRMMIFIFGIGGVRFEQAWCSSWK